MNYIEERPWGSFENLLDTDYCKVKRIIVKPGQRLSYQFHHKRTENKFDKNLIFIETQTGTYFGEDDIVRIEDDYGRDSDEN